MNPESTYQLPAALSTYASDVDFAYYVIYWVSVLFFVGIVGAMLYFVWKYRRRPGVKAQPTGHNDVLEVFWTASPLILLAFFFYIGFTGYMNGVVAPAGAHEIRATGKRWAWEFKHMPKGGSEAHQLVVPAGEPVKLIISAVDVLHSVFIPAFRVKRDAVPGMYSSLWFETPYETRVAGKGGAKVSCDIKQKETTGDDSCGAGATCIAEFTRTVTKNPTSGKETTKIERVGVCHHAIQGYCAEYCGAGDTPDDPTKTSFYNHSSMYLQVAVLPPAEYAAHAQSLYEFSIQPPPECQAEADPQACWGKTLALGKGCVACHSLEGATGVGPSFKGLWGRSEAMSDGTSVKVVAEDGENYIRESILQPNARVVSGFQPVMPSQAGLLSDPEIEAITSFIKSIGSEP